MDPSTNKRKGSEELPEPKRSKSSRRKRNGTRSRNKRPKPRQRNPILQALNENGSIDMELLKGICRGCLERLREKHAKGKSQSF